MYTDTTFVNEIEGLYIQELFLGNCCFLIADLINSKGIYDSIHSYFEFEKIYDSTSTPLLSRQNKLEVKN